MKHQFFILLFMSALTCEVTAQNEQIVVSPFTWEAGQVNEADAAEWYGSFLSEVMNVSPVPVLSWEGEPMRAGDLSALDQGARMGATHVITGHLLSVDQTAGVPNPQIHVCVYNVNTKLLEYSSLVSKSSIKQMPGGGATPNNTDHLTDGKFGLNDLRSVVAAVDISRADALQIQIRKFMNESFPPQLPLLGIEEAKGDRAVSVKFTGPVSLFNDGQPLEIIQWVNDGGYDRRLSVATGRVSAIEGQIIIVKLTGSKESHREVMRKINEDGVYITTKS